jgi:hypothetical protein
MTIILELFIRQKNNELKYLEQKLTVPIFKSLSHLGFYNNFPQTSLNKNNDV